MNQAEDTKVISHLRIICVVVVDIIKELGRHHHTAGHRVNSRRGITVAMVELLAVVRIDYLVIKSR